MSFVLRNLFITSSRYKLTYRKIAHTNLKYKNVPSLFVRAFSEAKNFDVSTKVLKDVILFKYENPKFYKYLNIFAITQFGFWTYLGHFAYTTLRNIPVQVDDPNLSWWKKINLGEDKYRYSFAILSTFLGWCILAASWIFTLRTVRYLVLVKGGDKVSIVTYAPFGENRILTVPLKYISCQQSRHVCKVQLPIKVQNKTFNYLLDMRGEFKNPQLFDYTAGMKRNLK